jgi:serine/threonine-protein kinase
MGVERVLAVGGVGAVYAVRKTGGERIALKVLLPRHAADLGMRSRFEREIAFALRAMHPNLVRARGRGVLPDGRPYLAMDLYEGTTLGAIIRERGPMPPARAFVVADEILAGLEALHASGIVHRDLQPDNVFLAREGAREVVKLLDLGFAHAPGVDTGDGVTPDSPGSLVGTLRFISPEQATRARAITERSDLFAASLLLYYSLTGTLPFRGSDDLDVVVAIVRSSPVPLRRERRDVPRTVDAFLARGLAKHPDARFASAAAMREELRSTTACEFQPLC